MLGNSSIRCNVIITSHITNIDNSSGLNMSPEQKARQNPEAVINPRGFPTAIGRALSPTMGKFFNDVFIVSATGSGSSVRRTISTVPMTINGVTIAAKNSVWLEKEYSLTTGLAEIFAALRGQPHPTELVNELNRKPSASAMPPAPSPSAAPAKPLATATGRTT